MTGRGKFENSRHLPKRYPMQMTNSPAQGLIAQRLAEALAAFADLDASFFATVERAANLAIDSLKSGGRIYLIGNGGSAADAQHWAAELVGRFHYDHEPLDVHALTVNSSSMTALGNDFSADEVFSRQVRAHVRKGDVLVAISTSGNSSNILTAAREAKALGATVLGVTGKGGGALSSEKDCGGADLCEVAFVAPSEDTPRIQELHLFFGHCWCELIEAAFGPASK